MPEVNISDLELTCSNETVGEGLWMWKSWMYEDDISISFSFSQQSGFSWGNGADFYWKFLMRGVGCSDLIGCGYVRVPRSSKVVAEFPKGSLDSRFDFNMICDSPLAEEY